MSRTDRGCQVCQLERQAGSGYCPLHARVAKNLRDAFEAWNRAYGTILLTDFFERLISLSETGDRVRDLVTFYRKNPDKWKEEE